MNVPAASATSGVADDGGEALLQQLRGAGAGATAEGLRAAYQLAAEHPSEEGQERSLVPLLAVLSEQAAQMAPDMEAWVPYSFGPLYSFHLPPAAQALVSPPTLSLSLSL